MSFLQQGAVYVIACVILLGMLIFIHELGHFLVARWCGVRVEVFSLGFGRKIWKKVSGDTTYCISIVPLGGYVKMFGEQPGESIPDSEKAVSFTHKTVWQRIAIVLAGPLMNLFFAVFVFAVVAMIGQEQRAPVLGDIEAGSKAAQAGFRSGDRIVSVDGQTVATFDDVSALMDEAINQKLTFKVKHMDGTEADVSTEIAARANPNPLSLRETVGDIEGFSTLSRSSMVGVPKDSPLWTVGLRTGDRIVGIGDRKISFFRELEGAFQNAGEAPLSIEVERDGAMAPEKLAITLAGSAAKSGFSGLRLESPELYLAKVIDGAPAQKAGLESGDRIVAVAGKPVLKWEDVLNAIKGYGGDGGVAIDFVRDGENRKVTLEPQMTVQVTPYGSEDKRFTIGIVPTVEAAMPELTTVRTLNPAKAVAIGAQQSWEFTVITVLSFVRLFENKISPKTVGGLLSIGQAAGETMKMGFGKFLTMMAIISINLFILNLLPVPVLDGGHLVFYTIEAIKGSPLSLKKIEIAQQVGLFLLMGLMVFAMYNDVTRLIFGRM